MDPAKLEDPSNSNMPSFFSSSSSVAAPPAGSVNQRAEDILQAIPAFNLLMITPTPASVAFVPTLFRGLFGANDVINGVPSLTPQTSTSNNRISVTTATSGSTAREYIQSRQAGPPASCVHAVWYLLASSDMSGASGASGGLLTKEEISFGDLATLALFISRGPADEAAFHIRSVSLRMSGVETALISVDILSPASLSELSKRTEAALVRHADLRLVWVAAQRASADEKIATSIQKGMKLFMTAVGASAQPIPFIGGATGLGTMAILQSDIVKIYNFQDPGKVLLSKQLSALFIDAVTNIPVKFVVSLIGLSTVSGLWEAPGSARSIMIAIADLVLVLDALFWKIHTKPIGTPITSDEVTAVIKLYEGKKGGAFRRSLVHDKLGKKNIGTFAVWKSLKREEAQRHLAQVIEEHRYRG